MPTLPAYDRGVVQSPHIIILGAGASIAAYIAWGREGNSLPSMMDLAKVAGLEEAIIAAGYDPNENFESFYDRLSSSGSNPALQKLVEDKIYQYFSNLKLPDKTTLYDYLILSLRKKDIIATFNWDPFLLQAWRRNHDAMNGNVPELAFLHGNVLVGACIEHKIKTIQRGVCSECGALVSPTPLLYPVSKKNYTENHFIRGEWESLKFYLRKGYLLTVFGYAAPETDAEAKNLMLGEWQNNSTFELAQVDIIDVKNRDEVEENWKPFFCSHHYGITNHISKTQLWHNPRRSCDAFAAATLQQDPWATNEFPLTENLQVLQEWLQPLVKEEIEYEKNKTPFSGSPLPPLARP